MSHFKGEIMLTVHAEALPPIDYPSVEADSGQVDIEGGRSGPWESGCKPMVFTVSRLAIEVRRCLHIENSDA